MEDKIKELLLENSEALFGTSINEGLIQFQKTKKEFDGDITLVVFPFVKLLRSAPEQAAEKIGSFIVEHFDLVEKYNVVKGFLNLDIADG